MSENEVVVRRQWNSHGTGTVEESSLSEIHWSEYSGGVRARSPRPFLHAYMSCDALLAGEIEHSCRHGEGPHRIKVCMVKKDNDPNVFKRLKAQAESRRDRN
jgi:hypothetical protein